MPVLSLFLLGSFQAILDGRPITGLESNKVRALLAYLAVEEDRPHSRDELIGLLWPDQPDATARANLRQALANLRNVIGDRTSATPFLATTSDSIQFHHSQHCSIDVIIFSELLAACRAHMHRRLETCRSCAQRLQQAVEWYRGDFLAQFVQSGSEPFEEWALLQRERLHREALEVMDHLTQHFEWRGDYPQALRYAQRQLELDPWREEAHRQVMRALALTERRSAALAQYETCRRVLAQELSAQPAEETVALYEQIKTGAVTSDIRQRPWPTPATPLIGRESELAEANAIWHKARTGEGQVLLISGEPGIGKTRLTQELIAQERYGNATVLLAECYAEAGASFAPIAQMIQAALDPSGASPNPKGLAPSIIADLITFVPTLRDRFPDVPPNLPLEPQAEQQRRFDSVATFLATLAARAPVMLMVEDAHWADSATLSLLRHIARRVRRAKLLIVATHRDVDPDETRLFHEWLGDLQRERLATSISLTRLDKDNTRDLLVEIFKEPITPEFLDGIYGVTEGNPFFVTEVCQTLIDEGAVYREGERWQRLSMAQIQIPRSVRLTIQRRIDRLPEATQDALQRAAVLGREFEFDVLQAMSDLDEESLIDALETAQRARLIDEVARVSHFARVTFAFVHALIPSTLQEVLNSLPRQRLHQRAAQVIEQIAQQTDRVDDLAAHLAQHYAEAGEIDKAIEYWLKAGDRARSVYAYDEAIEHYRQALALLKESGPGELPRAARTAMNLSGLYHSVLNFEQAQQAHDEAFNLWKRANEAPAPALSPAPHALRGYWGDIQTLDATLANNGTVNGIVQQLFSGLVELTPNFDLIPMLARRWEILDGGRCYVFYLRHDARWSDGQPVTARDFLCAWQRTLDPATHSPNAEYLYPIKNARAVSQGEVPLDSLGLRMPDAFTLVIELEEPTGYFLQLLTCTVTFAIPCHTVEAYGTAWCEVEHLVTNGPFRLTEWLRGDKLILARNLDYCGRFSGNLERVELTLMPFEKRMLDRYDAGEQDISEFPADVNAALQVRQQYQGEHVSAPMAHTIHIGFDATRPPFDDVRVRQAFVHAVDRKALVADVLHNLSTPSTGGFVPPGLPGCSPQIGLAYDPERARRLLTEAGYPQGRGFPAIETSPQLDADDWFFRYLAAQWREHLGIEVTWQMVKRNDLVKWRATHRPHLFTSGWLADYPDPDNFLRVALHQSEPYQWQNAQYEQLLDSARRVTDPLERLKFYQAADRLLSEEAGIMPLAHNQWHFLIKPWVKQYAISAVNAYYWKDVIIEPHSQLNEAQSRSIRPASLQLGLTVT